jgi:hypothetical protein
MDAWQQRRIDLPVRLQVVVSTCARIGMKALGGNARRRAQHGKDQTAAR